MIKQFRVPGRIASRLEELGVSVPDVLRRASLPKDLFQQTRVLVSTPELFALWHAIEAVSSDPLIGLKLGPGTNSPKAPHPMAVAALSTENLVAAVKLMARYKKLAAPEEILYQLDEDEFSVWYRWLLAVDAEPHVLFDYCMAGMMAAARYGTGQRIVPLRVEYLRPRANIKALERHFGCPVINGGSRNAIVFRAADALTPFVTKNNELLDMLAPQFEEQLKQSKEEDSFVELVRRSIQNKMAGHRPSIDEIADALHMGSRTLQRRLQDSGSSFQQVLDEARRQMARYYLGNSALELNEAAFLLGFEDSNSFTRAFRKWEGIPPGTWRETQRAARPS
jgi:AraC-like DNA-binding protein